MNAGFAGPSLAAGFARQVEAQGERAALWARAGQWSYRELDRQAKRVAAALLARTGPRPATVGLLFAHGLEMAAGVIGTIRAGHCYLPLDASYPVERLRFMLEDSGAVALVTHGPHLAVAAALAGALPILDLDGLPDATVADPAIDPEQPAYVLYTSGSTGRPKGVRQTHRNVLYHMRTWATGLGMHAEDRVSLQSAYGWDSAVQDTFAALLSGATLCPINLKEEGVGGVLDWLREARITIYHSTLPIFRSVVAAMAARGARLDELRVLALGGDFIYRSDVEAYQRHCGPGCTLVSAYGATESSSALMNRCDHAARFDGNVLPLGRAVDGTEVDLIDDDGRPVEGAGEGEVVVRGAHVAPGYFRAAPEDQARFTVAADGSGRWTYRTGDLARRAGDGTLVLLGRRDFQVKIGGMRVELGEVEGALCQHPRVAEAVVTAREDQPGDRYLAAYVVRRAGDGVAPTVDALRDFLALHTPPHAVPTRFTFLPALPLTVNAKIDRAALPPPDRARPALSHAFAAPRTALERRIAALWCEVLGVDEVGVDDRFFDLGGTSLRMAALNERVARELGRRVSMVEMYRAPTIRSFAAALDGDLGDDGLTERAAARADRRADLTAAATARRSVEGSDGD